MGQILDPPLPPPPHPLWSLAGGRGQSAWIACGMLIEEKDEIIEIYVIN